ncbi:MAG: molybdenum ABC transporter ATP-binding protein [Rhodospirillaceae bacterium]|nr:molybdenum ABC transporter ATP-binding protein [Rhodospirillaceae bacterium]
MLDIDVAKQRAGTALEIRFESAGGVTALFGRSGAGKTSTVQMIAGLMRPDAGRIAINGRVLFDSHTGIDLAAPQRRVGVVFQEGRLFPHLTVRRNLLYAKAAGDNGRYGGVIAMLGLEGLLERKPATLSGGEQQRVAIGRALLSNPDILLMDEPLASLDAARKAEILPYIERLRDEAGPPIVYVSHQIDEVARLADRIVLLSDGSVAATGSVDEIFSRPDLMPLTGRFQAGAVLGARVAEQDVPGRMSRLAVPGGSLWVPSVPLPVGSAMRIRVRARDVSVALDKPDRISIRNTLPGTVVSVTESDGPFRTIAISVADETGESRIAATVTANAVRDLGLAPGVAVFALIKSVAMDRRSMALPPRDEIVT